MGRQTNELTNRHKNGWMERWIKKEQTDINVLMCTDEQTQKDG